MRQEDAAEKSGVSLATYRKYEQGASIPTAKALTLSRLFGVTVDYLLSPLSEDIQTPPLPSEANETISNRSHEEQLARVETLVKQLLELDPSYRKLVLSLAGLVSGRQ